MAEMNAKSRKLSMNLSHFTSTETPAKPSIKSPRNFEGPNGVVGLGILAAMNNDEYGCQDPFFKRSTILAISPRSLSNPIPIFNKKFTPLSVNNNNHNSDNKDNNFTTTTSMELCEEYTCVISHVGHNQIKKKEYFDNCSTTVVDHWVSSGLVVSAEAEASSSSAASSHGDEMEAFPTAEFLSSCFLCKKQLHGLDIFMYRGEKAFCSAECRHKQISLDEHKEKSVSGTMKPLEYSSASPCSSPMQFFVGVAAA